MCCFISLFPQFILSNATWTYFVRKYMLEESSYEEVYAQLLVHRFFLPPWILEHQHTAAGAQHTLSDVVFFWHYFTGWTMRRGQVRFTLNKKQSCLGGWGVWQNDTNIHWLRLSLKILSSKITCMWCRLYLSKLSACLKISAVISAAYPSTSPSLHFALLRRMVWVSRNTWTVWTCLHPSSPCTPVPSVIPSEPSFA
jgi:hypothetical protein